jgi:hypothetical protein
VHLMGTFCYCFSLQVGYSSYSSVTESKPFIHPPVLLKQVLARREREEFLFKIQEVIKEVTGTEEEACHSPQRDFSPPPPPELEEVPSSTKTTTKKGKKLHFSSSPSTASTKVRNLSQDHQFLKRLLKNSPYQKSSILQKKKG